MVLPKLPREARSEIVDDLNSILLNTFSRSIDELPQSIIVFGESVDVVVSEIKNIIKEQTLQLTVVSKPETTLEHVLKELDAEELKLIAINHPHQAEDTVEGAR